MQAFDRFFSYGEPASWVNRLRRRRAAEFRTLLEGLRTETGSADVLDVGGTYHYWQMMGLPDPSCYQITLLNMEVVPLPSGTHGFASMTGDARALPFPDRSFDVVFSNSVIEHMGSREGQRRMADEIRRVGKRYCVQTPNYWFPIEPHCRLPLFQFMPRPLRALLIRSGCVHYFPEGATYQDCLESADSILMLTAQGIRSLFPEARLVRERFMGMVKSYTAVHGWPAGGAL